MDDRDLLRRRLHAVRLTGPRLACFLDVVDLFVAVQAQDYGPAKWSLAHRSTLDAGPAIDRALADGQLVRTHVLRPTWHLVRPADIRAVLSLTRSRVHTLNASYYRACELDDAIRRRCHDVLAAGLEGGARLTRKEIEALLLRAGIHSNGLRTAYILMSAELDGVVCSGGLRGKQHTYALLDERVPEDWVDPDEALANMTRRYFTGHGPATAKDYRWWSSLAAADVRRGLDMVAADLHRDVVDGVEYWSSAPSAPVSGAAQAVHLIQAYDEFLVGYSESKHLCDVTGGDRRAQLQRSPFNQVVLLDGRVAGHWRAALTKTSVTIETRMYEPLDARGRCDLAATAAQYGEFLGLPASMVQIDVA